jgi:hypothetical protein
MSRIAWVACVLFAAAVGYGLGRQSPFNDRPHPPGLDPADPEFLGPIRVARWARGQAPESLVPERYELTPHRITVDGCRVFDPLDGQDKAGDIWRIELADGRVVILAAPRKAD